MKQDERFREPVVHGRYLEHRPGGSWRRQRVHQTCNYHRETAIPTRNVLHPGESSFDQRPVIKTEQKKVRMGVIDRTMLLKS